MANVLSPPLRRPADSGCDGRRLEAWAGRVIADVRAAPPPAAPAPAAAVAHHRDHRGPPLPLRVAAVELLNLVRPVVAIANYVAFAALALERRPDWRPRLAAGDVGDREAFAHEVRLFPFAPFVGSRVRVDFD